MSSLAEHKLYYEDLTQKPARVGRTEMSNTIKAEAPKASKKRVATRGEHAKDIVIAILVTAVIGFIAGMHFSNQQHTQLQNAVKAASAPVAQAEAKK